MVNAMSVTKWGAMIERGEGGGYLDKEEIVQLYGVTLVLKPEQ